MQNNVLLVSENFRKMAIRSVLSIVLFLFTYVILVIMGIGVIFLCGVAEAGIMEVSTMRMA